jgi:hypothetical protein
MITTHFLADSTHTKVEVITTHLLTDGAHTKVVVLSPKLEVAHRQIVTRRKRPTIYLGHLAKLAAPADAMTCLPVGR